MNRIQNPTGRQSRVWRSQKILRIRARVSCPLCGAQRGENCRTIRGFRAAEMHLSRILKENRHGSRLMLAGVSS
jgi:hypothetical protein